MTPDENPTPIGDDGITPADRTPAAPRRRRLLIPVTAALGVAGVTAAVLALTGAGGTGGPADTAAYGNQGTGSPTVPPGPPGMSRTVPSTGTPTPGVVPDDPFSCPEGQLPGIEKPHRPAAQSRGAPDPEAALATLRPHAEQVTTRPFADFEGAPVWLEADGETFHATRAADGTWHVSPAEVIGCRTPPTGSPG